MQIDLMTLILTVSVTLNLFLLWNVYKREKEWSVLTKKAAIFDIIIQEAMVKEDEVEDEEF